MLRQVKVLHRKRGLPLVDVTQPVVVDLPNRMERHALVNRQVEIGIARHAPVVTFAFDRLADGDVRIDRKVWMRIRIEKRAPQAVVVKGLAFPDILESAVYLALREPKAPSAPCRTSHSSQAEWRQDSSHV